MYVSTSNENEENKSNEYAIIIIDNFNGMSLTY